jgi:hypothetical protein
MLGCLSAFSGKLGILAVPFIAELVEMFFQQLACSAR